MNNDLNYQLHRNINARQERDGNLGRDNFEHWLYEAKSSMQELERLPQWFKMLREGNLPNDFRYCSHSPTESMPDNKLICALGQNVATCPILKDVFQDTEKFSPDELDKVMTHICVVHILWRQAQTQAQGGYIDTSEGYIQDESDRLFWSRTYEFLASSDEAE